MSGRERTPEERRDLRERRSRRRQRRAGNEAANLAAKRRLITGPADEAALAYDQCRKRINQIRSGAARDAEWSRLAQLLNNFGDSR